MEYKRNPVKAIRDKCIDCMCGQTNEVKQCTTARCPLYPFRLGKNPYRTSRVITEEQRARSAERLRMYREKAKANSADEECIARE